MVLLALDTATRTTGLALHDGHQVVTETIWLGGGHQTVQLAPEVALAMRRVGMPLSGLTSLAVAQGPGSYTGLRIGWALAKGIALAHNLPLVGIPTLDILARAQPGGRHHLVAVLQAGRGRVAAVWYKWNGQGWSSRGPAESLDWAGLIGRLEGPSVICGEIDAPGREALRGVSKVTLASPAQCLRRPALLAEMALEILRSGQRPAAASQAPVYLDP
jgi:tRNA threonylcarbamoyladenosine biosynthesis protein TsaB